MPDGPRGLSAQWALWGQGAGDAGFQLLACSAGTISRENFLGVLTRYSPGTLPELPQVMIGWLSDGAKEDYLALAIHRPAGRDKAGPGAAAADRRRAGGDRGGREGMQVACYCMAFRELASGSVSYRGLYEELRGSRLPATGLLPVRADPPASEPAVPADRIALLATRAAALLLTGKPVCITGAGQLAAGARLDFLDQVAWLLPYGLRSRLSAATWASSSYTEHRFRLFFASTPRQRDDHVLAWGGADGDAPPVTGPAGDYLTWLRDDIAWRARLLARQTEVTDFSPAGVRAALARLGVIRDPAGDPAGRRPDEPTDPDADRVPARATAASGVPAGHPAVLQPEAPAATERAAADWLLRDLARALEHGSPRPAIAALRQHLAGTASGPPEPDYQRVIAGYRLLREDLPVDPVTRADLYDVLLRLAFGRPLSYAGFCSAADCSGIRPGQLPHAALLLAAQDQEPDVPATATLLRLLWLAAAEAPPGALNAGSSLTPDSLVAALALPGLRRLHADLACDVLRQATELDRAGLREALRKRQYIAGDLAAAHPGEPEQQVVLLCRLLRLAYGTRLDQAAAREISDGCGPCPSPALLAAVQLMSGPGDQDRPRPWRSLRRAAP